MNQLLKIFNFPEGVFLLNTTLTVEYVIENSFLKLNEFVKF